MALTVRLGRIGDSRRRWTLIEAVGDEVIPQRGARERTSQEVSAPGDLDSMSSHPTRIRPMVDVPNNVV